MNVTCAAVSKWERGETYPDITLLQPLAYFFEVTLDELMGYDQKKVQADIDETIALYRKHWKDSKGREIIVKAYHDYPNDYRIMHYYMWNIGGDMADNNPTVLIEHKEEFLSICENSSRGGKDGRSTPDISDKVRGLVYHKRAENRAVVRKGHGRILFSRAEKHV